MKNYSRITPEGTRDYLFEECRSRHRIEKKLSDIFSARGFREVMTPGLEYYDVFDPAFSGIGQEVLFKMSDRQGRIVVMRPDNTLPIARLAATRLQNLRKPLRLFYVQPIYRSHPGLAGRSSEDVQAGVELLGAGGFRTDLEVLATAVEALNACAPGFRMEIGHAGFFRSLAKSLPDSGDFRERVRGAVESKNYGALDVCLSGLGDSPQIRALRALPRLYGGEEVFEKAAPFCTGELEKTLCSLRRLYRTLAGLGLGGRLMADLGLVQRNDYYTGIVFSAYLEGCGDAVLRGGRYDGLLEHFGEPMPAVGFGVDVDALTRAALERCAARTPSRADVLVHGGDGYELAALKHAAELIAKGLRCETSVFPTEEDAAAYARACGIRRMDVVGSGIRTVRFGEGKA